MAARVAPRCTWQRPHLGSSPRTGRAGEGAQVLATRDQPWTAQVLWAALPQPTRSLYVPLPATVSGFLWEGEGGQSESQVWAAGLGMLSVLWGEG